MRAFPRPLHRLCAFLLPVAISLVISDSTSAQTVLTTVSVLNGSAGSVVATSSVGSGPGAIAVNSVTNTIYVANELGNAVSVISGSANTVRQRFLSAAPP